MKVDTIQTNFSSGEIAPSLYGRTDIAQYGNACATLENFLVRPYGSIISTPGTEYINECKTGGSTGMVRLISFIFSRTDSYVIEIGVGYFRFYTDGGVVLSGATPYEVSHTFTEDEIFDVQFSQIHDVIYLTHPDHKPQKLTRKASASWTLEDFDFKGGPFLDDNIIYSNSTTYAKTSASVTPSATAGSITLSADDHIFIASGSTLGHVGTFWKVGGFTTDATTGLEVQGYVQIDAVTNPSTATATVVETLDGTSATDIWAQGAWSDVLGWPARVTFHQQRLAMARTAYQPQNLWLSKSFVFDNFAVNNGNDDDAINIQLASNESNDIKWLASAASLAAGTYGGEFVITGGEGGVLTPANASARKETGWGSEAIIPKKIGNFFYYVQRFGKKLRELFYFWDLDTYKSVNKTILSPHITGDGIIDMAYQQNPDTVLWCVTTNGNLATLTREVDQEVQGWAVQKTDGNYESVAVIPSLDDTFDEVYVVVNRTVDGSTKRYIERFKNQEIPDRQDKCFYVHSGLSYDAYIATSSVTLGLSATAGTSVVITSSSSYFSSDDVGQRIRAIDSDGVTLGEAEITAYTSGTNVVAKVKSAFDASSYAAQSWGLSISSLSGLGHLEAETVVVAADGGTDKPNKVVSNGTITLAYDYFVVTAGLPYTQKFKSLPQESGSRRGTSQGKIQRINEVGFKLNRSFKGFQCGGTDDYLEQVEFRDPSTLMGTPEALYTGTIPNISFRDDYQYGSQVIIQNDEPFPIELLSLMTSIDTMDK